VRWLFRFWGLLPRQFQLLLIKTVQRNRRLYRWLMFRHYEQKDRADGNHAHLPPPEMRYRVGASPEAEQFVAIGKTCAEDIRSALQKVGCELESFSSILDFGCGCGRTLVHMQALAPNAQFSGIDIDAGAIDWCKKNLNFASFSLSKEKPPIDYEANTFDFVYAISVFTHLDEQNQFRWLEELRRITKPGGIVLLTVHGLNEKQQGFVFERTYEEGLFPAWYQNTYHSKEYVLENFGKSFQVLNYDHRGMNNHQDVVVLQKRPE
jgi:SAM-dependent methyltransferase